MFVVGLSLYFIKGFFICIHYRYWSVVFSFCCCCYVLNQFWPHRTSFLSHGALVSCKCLAKFSSESVWSWAFLCWEIFITTLIHCLLLISLGFLYVVGTILVCHMCLEICQFLLDFPIYSNIGRQNSP